MKSFYKSDTVNKKIFKSLFFGIVIGSLVMIALMLIYSVIILQTGSAPSDELSYIILVFIGVGSLVSGYIAGRIYKKSGLAIGAISGAIMFLILFLSGVSNISEGLSIISLLKLFVTIIPSILGSVLGVNKKEKLKIK